MNRNASIGLVLVIAALALACLIVISPEGPVRGFIGEAVWYLPYAAFVVGIRRLVRARARIRT